MEEYSRERSRAAISLYLLIDNRLTREALARLFQRQPKLSVVGQGSSRDAIFREIIAAGCDVLLADSLDGISALEGFAGAGTGRSKIKIILFGMEENAESFLSAVRRGISGYLLKDASAEEIVSAVRSAARGEAVCPARLCAMLFGEVAGDFRRRSGMADDEAGVRLGLTWRQRQLIPLIARGMSNKEIASDLNLSEYTVKGHIYRMMKLVEAGSRQDVVAAVRWRGVQSGARVA